MDYLPLHLDVRAKHCVVVGGSEVAASKIAPLLNAGTPV